MPRRHKNAQERKETRFEQRDIKRLMEKLHGRAKATELMNEAKLRERKNKSYR